MRNGETGIARLEAFSDGVLAIILTIMVLEMKAPEQPGFHALWRLWPTFFAYVLSYVFIAMYWTNHHRLFSHARKITDELIWANFALLFSLSLIPFSTALVGRQLTSATATAIYLATLLSPSLAYFWLQKVISQTGLRDETALAWHHRARRKGLIVSAIYLLAIPLSFVSTGIGLSLAGGVAAFWIWPARPDRSSSDNHPGNEPC